MAQTVPPLLPAAAPVPATLRYVFPFALFLCVMGVLPHAHLSEPTAGAVWFAIFVPVCFWCWPRLLSTRPMRVFGSTALGLAVFALWVAPDLLIPGYRNSALFSNSLWTVHSSFSTDALHHGSVLFLRTARAALIVPVVEELFWRAWMMRWLIDPDFQRVRLGTYAPAAFWITAILFGSEHGSYWDVGLVTGIIYNWWLVRTKSLVDCILMHAVTNLALSVYVITTGNWQYWQ